MLRLPLTAGNRLAEHIPGPLRVTIVEGRTRAEERQPKNTGQTGLVSEQDKLTFVNWSVTVWQGEMPSSERTCRVLWTPRLTFLEVLIDKIDYSTAD